ncbi:C3HC zinc finger-like-domain-containing protein [Neurospora hispaniola]|uniref:C3HC zinc finger-like-domain-containing protein n=1 Tax=Neurospora hispaniola TaxID=588809 RepID=A0AAJ0MRS7_9PEZI|nr:C3HC zinc finger-like-domain-containing protein [Neurospora hispaniola]
MNATVKRKFNSLLQGIGNRPTNPDSPSSTRDNDSLSSTPASSSSSRFTNMANDSLDYLSKKRRVGGLPSTPSAITLTTPAKGQTTISNVTLRKWNSHGGPGSSPAPGAGGGSSAKGDSPVTKLQPPKYCPGDRDQLVRRLATFQELTDWTPKPDRVNEIEWAKRGWVCQGKERVKCTLCNNELAVKLNRKEVDGKEIPVLIAADIAESVVDQYVELIITSHREDCLWRKKGCDDSLLRLPLPNPKLALETLRQRYDELCQRKDFLPYEFNLRLPEGLDIDIILSYLPPNFFAEPPASSTADSSAASQPASPNPSTSQQPQAVNRTALALALLGWQGLTNPRLGTAVPNSASCHTCLRRLGLWMFKSKQVDPETNTILVPAPMDHLDPLREHRFFCPWKNPQAQRNPGAKPLARGETDKAAWEVLVEGLKNESRLREKARDLMHGRSKSSSSGFGFGLGGKKGTPHRATGSTSGFLGVPMTPDGRGVTGQQPNSAPGGLHVGGQEGGGGDEEEGFEEEDDDESEEARKKKDQAMMSRLKRVKTLFNTKGSKLKKLGASPSPSPGSAGTGTAAVNVSDSPRPGSSHSTRTTGTSGTAATTGVSTNAPAE